MNIAVWAGLSDPQNQLFHRRLDNACRELGLERRATEDPVAADIAYLCGFPASKMLETHRPLLAPALPAARYQAMPWYFVDIVARHPEVGLASGRWAYNQTTSFSGWLATRHGLRLHHLEPDAIEWIASGSHSASIEAVRDERADLAGIDSMILDLDPEIASDLAVIDSWGPWPTPPVMVSRSLDLGLVRALAEVLLGTDGDVAWVSIDPDHLDPIAAVADTTIN